VHSNDPLVPTTHALGRVGSRPIRAALKALQHPAQDHRADYGHRDDRNGLGHSRVAETAKALWSGPVEKEEGRRRGVSQLLARSSGQKSTGTKPPESAQRVQDQAYSVRTYTMARAARLVICLDNKGYEASLERRKIYVAVPDAKAKKLGQLRVVDESGEDYLYPAEMFIAAELPQSVRRAVLQSA
jgi:hypothetical protein